MRHATCLLIVSLVVMFSGCASILSENSYPVAVNSSTPGVEVSITNEDGKEVHRGSTPFTVTLPAASGYFDGETYSFTSAQGSAVMVAKLDPWYIGNIIFGGLLGMLIVDPATGSMWLLPDSVFVGGSSE